MFVHMLRRLRRCLLVSDNLCATHTTLAPAPTTGCFDLTVASWLPWRDADSQIPLALAENSGLAPIESLSEVKAMQASRPAALL